MDFHRPSADGRHTELFNWVLRYFAEPKIHTPPLYLQHQGMYNYYFFDTLALKNSIHKKLHGNPLNGFHAFRLGYYKYFLAIDRMS